jgi:hypothetical protein
MEKKTLTEIVDSVVAAMEEAYDQETGEVNEEGMAALDALALDLDEKGAAYGAAYRAIKADAAALKAEAGHFALKAKRTEDRAERLRAHLFAEMERAGVKKIGTTLGSATIQKSAPKLVVTGEVPDEYMVTPDPKPDNKAIVAALKAAGGPTEWAELQPSTHLRFR